MTENGTSEEENDGQLDAHPLEGKPRSWERVGQRETELAFREQSYEYDNALDDVAATLSPEGGDDTADTLAALADAEYQHRRLIDQLTESLYEAGEIEFDDSAYVLLRRASVLLQGAALIGHAQLNDAPDAARYNRSGDPATVGVAREATKIVEHTKRVSEEFDE